MLVPVLCAFMTTSEHEQLVKQNIVGQEIKDRFKCGRFGADSALEIHNKVTYSKYEHFSASYLRHTADFLLLCKV